MTSRTVDQLLRENRELRRRLDEAEETVRALRAGEADAVLVDAGQEQVYTLETADKPYRLLVEQMYGLPEGGFGGRYEDWTRTIHPDDMHRAEAERRRAVAEHTELDSEFRIVRADGEMRWIASKGKVWYAEDGEPLRMLGVSQDITERKHTEEELRDADRKKDEFLATLAHELRNPLAPIRNAVQILKSKGPAHPELIWAREVLDRQVQLMARLLEDLLDVSRISRNQLELRKERVDLVAAVEIALETSRPVIEASRHELTVALPSEPVHLDADPLRLAQVFANLLNNAAKYTEQGGRIELSAERCGGEVVVSVTDSGIGIGIAAETLPHVFEIFSQATPALVRAQGGLGVGLSLVKGLVELHGGSTEVRSDGPGRGSTFAVRLPLAPETATDETIHPLPHDEAVPTEFRILIVDDNRDSADSLARLLEVMGNEVGTAYDGEEAVDAARTLRPDVVLLDIGMPKLNGYEVCRRIREQPSGRGMFLIALTGWGREEDRQRTKEAGFDAHMVKPVDAAALMRVLGADPSGANRPFAERHR